MSACAVLCNGMNSRISSRIERLLVQLDDEYLPSVHQDDGALLSGSGDDDDDVKEQADISDTVSTDTTPDSITLRRPKRDSNRSAQQVLALLQERKALEVSNARELAQRDEQLRAMRAVLEQQLQELQNRQKEVEMRTPLLQSQLRDARSALSHLQLTDASYQELLRVPEEQLVLADVAKLRVYEHTKALKGELERARSAALSAQEAAARSEQECARLRRENARVLAAAAERDSEAEAAAQALQSRLERVSAELEAAVVSREVLGAKGAMYDELAKRTEQLEEENQRLRGAELALPVLERQVEEARAAAAAREHSAQLLAMDKAYLSKEVELLTDQVRRCEASAEAREVKLREVKAARARLHAQLAASSAAVRQQEAERLHVEVEKLRAMAAHDLERVRREAADAHDRETRLLRESRDTAAAECSRLLAEVRDVQRAHDELSATHHSAVNRLELRVTELSGELRLRDMDLARTQAQCDEQAAALRQAGAQLELSGEKVRVLTESVYELEAQLRRAERVGAAGGGAAGATLLLEPDTPGREDLAGVTLDEALAALRRKSSAAAALSARVADAERQLAVLQRDNQELNTRCAHAQKELEAARARVARVSQPHAYLSQLVERAEAQAAAATAAAEQLRAELADKQNQIDELASERDQVKQDLQDVLGGREGLEAVKRTVLGALHSTAQPAVGRQAGAGGLASGPSSGSGAATAIALGVRQAGRKYHSFT